MIVSKRIIILNATNAVPQREISIAKTLSSLGHECSLWNWQREERGSNTPEFRTTTFKTAGKRFVYFAAKVFLHLIKERCDCILFFDFRLFPVVVLAGKMKNAKIFYDSKEVPIVTAAERIKKVIRIDLISLIKMLKLLEHMLLKCVDGMITIPLQDVETERYYRLVCNVEVVRGFPSLAVKPVPTERLIKLKSKRFIIYSGTIARYTGLYLYLQLIKRLQKTDSYSDVVLVLAGKLSGISAEELQAAIKSKQLEDSVVYLAWIPYEELLSVISRALVGLALFDPKHLKFNYISEGTSRKIYTYMYCGIPVVTNSPLGEFVKHDQCGVVIPYSDEQLYSSVLNLLNDDDDMRRTLGDNGRNAVLTRYNWEKESEKIIRVFENMWGKGDRRK